MESTKQNQRSILRSIDKKISALKEFIYQLKDNQTLLTIEADREALINACNSLEVIIKICLMPFDMSLKSTSS